MPRQAVLAFMSQNDRIELDFTDRRASATQRTYDFTQEIWSPRVGAILKPAEKYQRIAQTNGIPRDNH